MSVVAKWNHSREYWQECFHECATINRSKKIRNFLVSIFVGIFFVVFINAMTPFYYKVQVNYFLKGFSAALLLIMGAYYVNTYFSRQKFANSYQNALPGEAIFSDESFTIKTQNSDSTFKWTAVVDLVSSKRGLILYLRGGGVAYVPEAQIEDVEGKKKNSSMYKKAKSNSMDESIAL